MRTLGIILVAIGIFLRMIRAVSFGISWAVIIIGIILIFVGYFLKAKNK